MESSRRINHLSNGSCQVFVDGCVFGCVCGRRLSSERNDLHGSERSCFWVVFLSILGAFLSAVLAVGATDFWSVVKKG